MPEVTTQASPAPLVFSLMGAALLGGDTVPAWPAQQLQKKCPVSARNVLFGDDDTDAQDNAEF